MAQCLDIHVAHIANVYKQNERSGSLGDFKTLALYVVQCMQQDNAQMFKAEEPKVFKLQIAKDKSKGRKDSNAYPHPESEETKGVFTGRAC